MRHKLQDIDLAGMQADCSVCGLTSIRPVNKGKSYSCKTAYNESKRRSTKEPHGLTADEAKLYTASVGRCEVCCRGFDLVVDHDHNTGAIRGVLCRRCNMGLGLLGDSIGRVRALLNYLEDR